MGRLFGIIFLLATALFAVFGILAHGEGTAGTLFILAAVACALAAFRLLRGARPSRSSPLVKGDGPHEPVGPDRPAVEGGSLKGR